MVGSDAGVRRGCGFLPRRGTPVLNNNIGNAFRRLAAALPVVVASLMLVAAVRPVQAGQPAPALSASVVRQIQALQAEKLARPPAQQKIDSQLVYELKLQRNDPALAAVSSLRSGVEVNGAGNTLVDIRATSPGDLAAFLTGIGATVVSRFEHDVRASIPLLRVEDVAARSEVRWIMPAAKYFLNKNTTSEGDATHRAAWARLASGFTGTGVKVGVLSDSDDGLAGVIGTGDLPPGVTTVPGQSGSPASGEGTAMMEIVYDLAPNVSLFFATADGSTAQFGNNIRTLRTTYACDIIIDDITFFIETPFHQGDTGAVSTTGAANVIQAVNDVVTAGAMYFSSAANDQNFDQGFSGTWEGDWADGGAAGAPLPAGRVHDFGGGQTYDVLTNASNGNQVVLDLWWADPLGGSANDYDLYLLNSTGAAVLYASTNAQSGTQDPVEEIGVGTYSGGANPRIVIWKSSGASGRFLHLGTNRGRLSIGTSGATRGHNAIGGMSVAATPAAAAACGGFPTGPNPGPFVGTNVTECFSSDGFRRVFFDANNSAIAPVDLQKPDFTAADGVSCSTPGFGTFYGTSAAAPHAGAIAALLKSVTPALTNAQILNFMKTTSIDIMAGGVDRDSGTGIVMADKSMTAADPCILTCPANITTTADLNACSTAVSYPAIGSSGACGTVTGVPASGSTFPVGTTTVTATSESGSSCSFTVTVQDTQFPTITCPPDMLVQAPDETGTVVTWPAAVANDNCPGVVVSYLPPNGSHLPIGNQTITATATDASTNATSCTFDVRVVTPIPALSVRMLVGLAALLLLAGLFLLRWKLGS